MDPKTLGLLITATEYAVAATQRMIQESAGEPQARRDVLDRYVDLVFGLEVNFLFPNLSAEARDQLVTLMKIRNTLGMQLNGLPQWRTPVQKLDHDRVTADLKAEFFKICRQLEEAGVEKRLDRTQRQILQEEFMSILVEKEDSTRLFFRTSAQAAASNAWTPAALPDPVGATAPAATVVAPGRPARILVIDRSYRDAETIARWLDAEGCETMVGDFAFESCRLALRKTPDVIILEYGREPGSGSDESPLDGPTMLKLLRELPGQRSVPVIALAPSDDPVAKPAAMAAGALACLRKPLERQRLLSAVRVTLEGLSPAITTRPHPSPDLGHPSDRVAA